MREPGKSAGLVLRTVAAGLLGLLLLCAGHTQGTLLYADLLVYLIPVALAAVLAAASGRFFPSAGSPPPRAARERPLLVLLFFLLLYLCSSATRDAWFYFLSWRPIYDGALEGGLARFALLTVLLTPLLAFKVKRPGLALAGLLLLAQGLCLYNFYQATGGGLLYRNDHPSFLFRLHVFSRTFPQSVNYLPQWNGGGVQCFSTTSGIPSIGIFYFPLWRLLPVHATYSGVVAFTTIVLQPLLAALAVAVTGGGATAAAIGGLLMLSLGQDFFRWAYEYGTITAVFACAFSLPFSAALFRLAWMPRRGLLLGLLIVVSGFFFLLWPPSVITALAVGLPWLANPGRWTGRKWVLLAACFAALTLLCGHWAFVSMFRAGEVTSYFGRSISEATALSPLFSGEHLARWSRFVVMSFKRTNPLVVFMGVAAVFVTSSAPLRRWYPFIFVPLLAAPLLEAWEPRLQMARFLLPLTMLAVVPAALALRSLIRTRTLRLAPVRAALAALLLLGALNAAQLYSNRGLPRFGVLDAPQREFVDFLAGAEVAGRVLFAGEARQAYGDGQVAYLPVLTGREMLALDYYHFPDEWTRGGFPPSPFAEGDGFFRYTELYNVSHVVAYDEAWVRRLGAEGGRYREVRTIHYPYGKEGHDAHIFRVLREPSFLLGGGGVVHSGPNLIEVRLDGPRERVVLKYNWADGLVADGPVEISPYDAGEGIRLIGVKTRGATRFSLRYRSRI